MASTHLQAEPFFSIDGGWAPGKGISAGNGINDGVKAMIIYKEMERNGAGKITNQE